MTEGGPSERMVFVERELIICTYITSLAECMVDRAEGEMMVWYVLRGSTYGW